MSENEIATLALDICFNIHIGSNAYNRPYAKALTFSREFCLIET